MKASQAKRLVAWILTVCMLLSNITLFAFADEGQQTALDFDRIYIATDSDDVSVFDSNDLTVRYAYLLEKEYAEVFGKKLLVTFGSSACAESGDVVLVLDSTLTIPDEGYSVSVEQTKVTVSASTAAGLFYGCREIIKQLKINGYVTAVEESPSVGERTLLLDVGLGAFSADAIMTLIREMSWVNMNTLILYFSEESGVGSDSRLFSCFNGCDGSLFIQTADAEGSAALTHSEIHEIVRFAALYNIEIVPSTAATSCVSYTDPAQVYEKYDPTATGNGLPLLLENPDLKTEAEILEDKLPLLRAYGVKCWKHDVNESVSYDAYTAAMDKLGACPALVLPDVSALEVLVAEYNTYKANELIYTASSFENYENSIQDAKHCIGPGYFMFTQTQIDGMVSMIEAAKSNLVKLSTDMITMIMVNELKGYIDSYNEERKNIYTLDSWHLYSNAIYAGKVLLEGRNYTDTDIMLAVYIVRESINGLTQESQVAAYRIDGLTSAKFRTARVRVGGKASMTVVTPRDLNLSSVVVVDENGDIVARGTEQSYDCRQPNVRKFSVTIPADEVGTHTYTVYGVVNDTRVRTGFLYTNDPITCKLTVVS